MNGYAQLPAALRRQEVIMASGKDFAALAIPHLDAANTLARWLLRDVGEAEDVVQEAYLRAFRAFDTFAGTEIKPWLLRIVRNCAYRRLTNRRRGSNVVSIEEAFRSDDEQGESRVASEEPNAEERLLASADRSLALDALAALSPVYREVIVLREIEELTYSQIAEISGIPIGTVMSRLSRARAELREAFHRLSRKHAR